MESTVSPIRGLFLVTYRPHYVSYEYSSKVVFVQALAGGQERLILKASRSPYIKPPCRDVPAAWACIPTPLLRWGQ